MTVPASRDSAIDQLLDRQAIRDCLTTYSRGVDRLDVELIRSAFWPDAHDAHGITNGSVEEFLAAWLPGQSGREACQHLLGNHLVRFDGASSADTETYMSVAIKSRNNGALELMGGRYLDRFEKRDGEWRIVTRLALLDWHCVADASGMSQRMEGVHRGTRDQSDPSYLRFGVRRREV